MNDSIEIIGEVTNNSSNNSIEIIYDEVTKCSETAKFSSSTPPSIRKRPKRERKLIRKYYEEQVEEEEKRERQLRAKQLSRQQQKAILQQQKDFFANKNIKPSTSKLSKQRSTKRPSNDDQNFPATKRIKQTARPEVGGAGTLSTRKKSVDDDIEILFEWDPAKVIADRQKVSEWQARSVINMFDQDNTLPFIARYRKDKTGCLEVEKLREIQNAYTQLKIVKDKVAKVLKTETERLDSSKKVALLNATTVHEVEDLSASLKTSSKRSYVEKAKELGLEPYAIQIIEGAQNKFFCKEELTCLLNPAKEGLRSVDEVEQGLRHVLADYISKHKESLDCIRELIRVCNPILECSRKKQSKSSKGNTGPSEDLCSKYSLYFTYSNSAWNTRPHQMLAMNRGVSQNVLSMNIRIPEAAYGQFFNFCQRKWFSHTHAQYYRTEMLMKSVEDGWERLVKPFMQRQIKSQLTEMAEIASVEVFAANLKKLLLSSPLRGKTVLAIDPGFKNGCKIAVTNSQGEMLLTTTIYPFKTSNKQDMQHWSKDHNANTLRQIVHKYGSELFAVGNGTACREMEEYLTSLINCDCFSPFNVQYTIVNESGASQYSVTPEAMKEFPNLDVNHISAVSLARRLQDPLLEYVKVNPMHLGVGMYQHDIPERILNASLDSVMTECVSFVGVDINSVSECVLRKLSGMNKNRAAKVLEHRQTNGPFLNRQQLMQVKGIGPRTFEQCAGFIRILPQTIEEHFSKPPGNKKSTNNKECIVPLDRTTIHPESYEHATKFMKLVGVGPQNIGSPTFIEAVRKHSINNGLDSMSEQCGCSKNVMRLIVEGLSQPLDYDIRANFDKPLFRKGITAITDLLPGTRVTGKVSNVTHFGAFVDIGVCYNGLVHVSRLNGMKLELGSVLEAEVINVELQRKRIALNLIKVIQ